MAQNAIIVGASSGIGAALARGLAAKGYILGLASRKTELLNELADSLDTHAVVRQLDISETTNAIRQLRSLASELGHIDLIVISSGVGHENPELDWSPEEETIATNVMGFAAMVNVAVELFGQQKSGTLVGISSIAAIRGNGGAPAYGASKAFVSHYLSAIRHKFAKLKTPVVILDVQPGFIDTAMAKGDGLFWVAPPAKAAQQIINAIDRRRTHVYVTRRWRIIAWILRLLPNWIYNRM
ncbi:MAG: SDR family NAD(P)-dependent oxidoreductase [Aureliella sp.]